MAQDRTNDDAIAADEWLAARLRGRTDAPPAAASLVERAVYHGVHALLVDAGVDDVPGAERLRAEARHQLAWELRHREVVQETLAVLASIGVAPVLFKGTPLAYSLYAKPALRARGDTDLIVPVARRADVERELVRLGFTHGPSIAGGLLMHQVTYVRRVDGADHALDLHWRLANSEVLSQAFPYQELLRDARPVPALGPHARAAGPAHALLIACLHRAVHDALPYHVGDRIHHGGDRMIWLYDIHLMVESFDPATLDACRSIAERKGLINVLADGVARARASFGTTVPASLASRGDAHRDPIMGYLRAGRVQREWLDFRALEGAGRKLRYLRELVFPPAAYMRAMYGESAPLAWLYLRRAARGVAKRL
jgi:hypothetical protein